MRRLAVPARIAIVGAILASSLVLALPQPALAQATEVWSRELPGARILESSPLLTDLNATGTLDVMVGAHNGILYGLNGPSGANAPGWPRQLSNAVNSSASAVDVDGDGRPELFIGAGVAEVPAGALYSFRHDGAERFRLVAGDIAHPSPSVHATPALGDINGGALDVSFATLGLQSIWAANTSGGVLPGFPFYADDTVFSSPALVDVNGDGRNEMVIGGDSSPGAPVDHQGGMVRAINGSGQMLWEFRIDDIVRSSPSVGDIDGDGAAEIVFGAGDFWGGADSVKVFALNLAGGLKPGWPKTTDGVTNASPTLADLNGDGVLDVAIGTFSSGSGRGNGGSVHAWDGRGNNLAGFPVASGGGVVQAQISTVDLDGDGNQDLLVPTGAFISVIDGRNGTRRFNLSEGRNTAYQSTPAVADVDGDGVVDIIAAGTRASDSAGIVTRWRLDANAELGELGWHQFRRDSRRTGSFTSPLEPTNTIPTSRIAGVDRFDTAARLSADTPGIGDTVYVATGRNFADALAGGPAASSVDGPVLLVSRDELPGPTRSEIQRIGPDRIVVLGGEAAVSASVFNELDALAGDGATRVAGNDRYATAAAISADAFSPGPPVAYVATGTDFPDALAGAAAGATRGGPVLLVTPGSIPSATSDELVRLGPASIVVLGGTNAVSTAVQSQLNQFTTGSVTRLAGNDRYATAVRVAEATFPNGAATPFVATGRNFPDALAGGPRAAQANQPLLLVPGRCVPRVVRLELDRLGATRLVLLGGTSALTGSVASLSPC